MHGAQVEMLISVLFPEQLRGRNESEHASGTNTSVKRYVNKRKAQAKATAQGASKV